MKTLLHRHRRTRAYSGLLTPDYILKFNTYLLAVVVPKCLTGRDHLFPLRNIYCLHCQKLIKRNIGTGDKNLSDHSNLSWMFQISDNFFWRLSNGRAHHGLPITRIVLKKILAVSQQTQMKLQELSPPLWRGRVYEFA